MKKGTVIKGPAIIRRRYKGGWEYALLHGDGKFSPFGHTPPSVVKWCYQLTWKDTLQKIHTITPEDRERGWLPLPSESECWWVAHADAPWNPECKPTLQAHSGNPPTL